jgi:hypothetical protein
MGILNLFQRPSPSLLQLPRGSFTVDCEGKILTSTLPSLFPKTLVKAIAQTVWNTFRNAREAHLCLAQLDISYPSLKITARELRGGAVVFLVPQTPFSQTKPD